MAGKNYGAETNTRFGNMQYRLVKAFSEGAVQQTSGNPPPANLYSVGGPEATAYVAGQGAVNPPGTQWGNPTIAGRVFECLLV